MKVDLKAAESSDVVNGAAASQICTRFAEEFSSIKAHDLNRTRELQCVSSGEVPAGAVVLNLREMVEENRAMRLIQSDTIKSETSFVERETGAILANQANPGFKTHEELIGFVGGSLTAQLLRSLAPAPNDPEYETWAKKVEEWNKAKMDMAANT